jgi:hypothetical protein
VFARGKIVEALTQYDDARTYTCDVDSSPGTGEEGWGRRSRSAAEVAAFPTVLMAIKSRTARQRTDAEQALATENRAR